MEQAGRSTIGVIYIPTTDECVYAEVGHGAWYEAGSASAERAKVSKCAKLGESLFVTSEVANFRTKERMDAYLRLDESCRLVRTWGDCFGYLLVATGRAELMVDPVMNIWDAAAIQPILEEAGGTFTDWQGERTIYNGEGIATNGLVLDEVLAITRNHK